MAYDMTASGLSGLAIFQAEEAMRVWYDPPLMSVTPTFAKLNHGWNAEPNAPEPCVELRGPDLLLRFVLNPFVYKQFKEEDRGILRFVGCARFRLGATNDHGWCSGQCRYSKLAPRWGEFYEISGDDALRDQPADWQSIGLSARQRHFLFYFRDNTFECIADDWQFEPDPANALWKNLL